MMFLVYIWYSIQSVNSINRDAVVNPSKLENYFMLDHFNYVTEFGFKPLKMT